MPADHIDPRFARTFREVPGPVRLSAVALGFDPTFTTVNAIEPVAIPEGDPAGAARDQGCYLLLLSLKQSRKVSPDQGREIVLEKGYYLYAGPPVDGLFAEIQRHRRRGKKTRGTPGLPDRRCRS